ncbi:hypothetical protein HLK59_12140 [Streptomyces sp. S3(2020)]|nr:hypothetical protein [Streptomyces sp. S3(2020)]NNN31109.1 hypothetical protein [Streptomyces sp. S3(2020)]
MVTSALGHALMSGDLLPWWAIGVALPGTASAGWWLTRRERGLVPVVGVTTAAQGLLHVLFDLTHELVHAPGAGAEHATTFAHSGMAMHMAHSASGMTMHMGHSAVGTAMAHSGTAGTPAALSAGTAMFLAHLLAAVVCGLWLWRGEAAAYRLGRALAVTLFASLHRVHRLLGHPALDRRPPAGRPETDTAHRTPRAPAVLRHAVVRRGPPLGPSAALHVSLGPMPAPRL